MRVHFIAIGGAVMHNLAIALHLRGDVVSGSDDRISEPSRSRLAKYGLLPLEEGWYPSKITNEIDAVILGMHAREDNPELHKAVQLSVPVYSFPEFLYSQYQKKVRAVIAGSHGKTTITAMVLHALHKSGRLPDYMVGASLEGFEVMVKVSEEADMAILEGDEYLTSPIDRRPKFLHYAPHIALISGIAWDHINVFPTEAEYQDQFLRLMEHIEPGGYLVYCVEDESLRELVARGPKHISYIPYRTPAYRIEKGTTTLLAGLASENEKGTTTLLADLTPESEKGTTTLLADMNPDSEKGTTTLLADLTPENKKGTTTLLAFPLQIFGKHNLQNLAGAMKVCQLLGLAPQDFLTAMTSFKGAARRLEKFARKDESIVFRDFAHAPSKLKATVEAAREQFPDLTIQACIELHTFSSLSANFLPQYHQALDAADEALVFYHPDTLKQKKLPPISPEEVRAAFGKQDIAIAITNSEVHDWLRTRSTQKSCLLLMSSGSFHELDIPSILTEKGYEIL